MRHKTRLLTGLLLFPFFSFAQNFTYDYEGQSVNYSVINGASKCTTANGNDVDPGNYVSGKLIIPSVALYIVNKDVIRLSVSEIGGGSFWKNSELTEVVIPNSVTKINGLAFCGTGLTSVTIPNSVTSIGPYAFSGCIDMTNISIPNTVSYIGVEAFIGCKSLKSVTIPSSETDIEDSVLAVVVV